MKSIPEARTAYDAARTELHAAAAAVEALPATTTPDELSRADSRLEAASRKADDTRRELGVAEARADAGVTFADRLSVTGEPATYSRAPGAPSFFADIAASAKGDRDAIDRLAANNRERYDLSNTTVATGGALLPPSYLEAELVALARGGRPIVQALGVRPLPPQADTISIPKVASGTTVDRQLNENAGVSDTDATFATVTASVKTLAGMQDASRQLIDRGQPDVDTVLFRDLAADYFREHEERAVTSSDTNALGLTQVTGVNQVTYTDTGPTVGEFYPKVADAVSRVATNAHTPATHIFMAPRRWAWLTAALDTTGRPLVTPNADYGASNAVALAGPAAAEGTVGTLHGLPVVTSSAIPLNLGTGTNEDIVFVVAAPELYVWEDNRGPYLETFHDVGSATLTVRFRLHNYVAQAFTRQPTAISTVSGTGMASFTL